MTLREAYEIQRQELIHQRHKVAKLEKRAASYAPLEEAHEKQRRELISLRHKVSKLEKQVSEAETLPVSVKEELEHQIRSRDYDIICIRKELRAAKGQYNNLKREYGIVRDEAFQYSMENDTLKAENERLTQENEILRDKVIKLEAEVSELNGSNEVLRKKLNTNFENSSLPSSALPFRKKIPNSRKRSGMTQGAQQGHVGHTAARLTPTMAPVHIDAPDSITENPDLYPTGKTITKQLIDISIYISVRDYIADEYRSRLTGSRVHAPFPAGIVNPVNYGPSLKAFAFLLNNYYNVSIEKTRQCISDLTNGVVSLSTGTICNLSKEFSVATKEDRDKIFSRLLHSDVLYSDATVSNINGKRNSVILCSNAKDVLFMHSEHKGHEGLSATPLKDFDGTIVHDHDKTYYSYGKHHQECLAHILRYLIGALENEPELTWHKQMHELLQEMIHVAKEYDRIIPRRTVWSLDSKYDEILLLAKKEYAQHPPACYYMDGFNLYKRLKEYKSSTLFFLRHPEVDFTNNLSERELRKFKRKQKQAVVLRSCEGSQRICDALTIIESARLQHQGILWVTQAAFTK